jgi:hypothetical protein
MSKFNRSPGRILKDCNRHLADKRRMKHEIGMLKREVAQAHTQGFINGNSAGVGGVMQAVSERLGLDGEMWLSNVMMLARKRKPPFNFDDKRVEQIVKSQIADCLRACRVRGASQSEE